jgi:hypothetical protein
MPPIELSREVHQWLLMYFQKEVMKIWKFALLAILTLVTAGCSMKPPTSQDASGNKSGSSSTSSSSAQSEFPPAKTPEELVENFKSALASGNTAAINKMVRWEGSDEPREFMMKISLSTGYAGTAKVIEATVRPAVASDQRPGWPRQSTHELSYTIQDNDGKVKISKSAPIALADQHYYFYFFAPETKK